MQFYFGFVLSNVTVTHCVTLVSISQLLNMFNVLCDLMLCYCGCVSAPGFAQFAASDH